MIDDYQNLIEIGSPKGEAAILLKRVVKPIGFLIGKFAVLFIPLSEEFFHLLQLLIARTLRRIGSNGYNAHRHSFRKFGSRVNDDDAIPNSPDK